MNIGWNAIVAVGLGGSLGAISRFFVAGWTQNLWKFGWFPAGTVVVNLIGCFALGALGGWSDHVRGVSPVFKAFLLIGLLGSFTTFSTFSYDNILLLRDGRYLAAGINGIGQLVLGVGLAFFGYNLVLRVYT